MRIASVQILRAIAALSVAVGHAQYFIGAAMEKQGQAFGWSFLLPWGAGVDLFFVISGFIMVYSSERLFAAPSGARTFVRRRLTRIVPLYWAAMVLVLVKMAAMHKPLPDLASIGASFLFIPWDTYGTGAPRPFYELGWTLNYEMFFYAVFALFLGFRREITVSLAAVSLGVLVIVGMALPSSNAQLFVWTQPIVLEFVLGMGLALMARNGFVLSARLRYALIALGAAAFFRDILDSASQPHAWLTPNDFLRVAGWGVPAAMILAGCVLKDEERLADNRLARAGALLGDASYALYLSHPIVLSAFFAGWFAVGLDKHLPASSGVALSLVASIVASIILYSWFEFPVTRFLQERLRPVEGGPRVDYRPSSREA